VGGAGMATIEVIACANCGEPIGRMETPRVFREQVVCAACWEKLKNQHPGELDYARPANTGASPMSSKARLWSSVLAAALLLLCGLAIWMQQRQKTNASFASSASGPTIAIEGGCWLTMADGHQEIGRGVTVIFRQPSWTPDQENKWKQDINAALARACQQIGDPGEPPIVSLDHFSVQTADMLMRVKYQMKGPSTRWNNLCTS
jgi:hypothetical protein